MVVSVAVGGAAVFGALIGSFLNVVVYRVPAGRSVVSPPSACGSCGARIRVWDNVPMVSWMILRGKCRDCASKISFRYPLVELGAAAFFAVVTLRFLPAIELTAMSWSAAGQVLVLVAFLYLAAISLALALIDLDTHTLPNAIVLPAYLVAGLLLTASSLGQGEFEALLTAGVGGLALGSVYLLLALVYPGAMGFGDVKLAGVLGIFLGWLGWDVLIVGSTAAFLLGGLFGVALLVSRTATAKSGVPFGPWMLAGAWIAIFAGAEIASGYLALFGLGES